jgi:hypothetical protein
VPRPTYAIAISSAFSVRHRITRLLWSKPFSIRAGDTDQVKGRNGFGPAGTMSNPTQTLTGDTAIRSPIKPSGTAISDARGVRLAAWRAPERIQPSAFAPTRCLTGRDRTVSREIVGFGLTTISSASIKRAAGTTGESQPAGLPPCWRKARDAPKRCSSMRDLLVAAEQEVPFGPIES